MSAGPPVPLRAVLCDLDGTLVDSVHYWFAVVQAASRHFGGRQVTWDAYLATFGQSAADDAAQFFPGAPQREVDRFYNRAVHDHGHQLRLADGALDLLRWAAAQGHATGCITNSPRQFTEHVLERTGLGPLLQAVCTADDVARPKPAPDLVHAAAARLGVEVGECVVVGDSAFDVQAAAAAGCHMVGVAVEAPVRVERLLDVRELLAHWTGVNPPR